jgi:hypothetical protein
VKINTAKTSIKTEGGSNDVLYSSTCMLLAKFDKFPTLQQAEVIKPTYITSFFEQKHL